jgi:hypothetical protein
MTGGIARDHNRDSGNKDMFSGSNYKTLDHREKPAKDELVKERGSISKYF